jgi:lipopolysaccharide export system protein LptC
MTRWVLGVLLALGALASGWLSRYLESSAPPSRAEGREPDFFMTDFTTVAMNPQGVPGRELQAEHVVHFADTDTEELTLPRLCFRLDQPNPWCVTSERGWVSSDEETVHLLGDVHLWRKGGADGSLLDVYTRDVTVLTRTEQAHTDAAARIVGSWGVATGIGLVARLPESQVDLLSNVKTRYETKNR